MESIQALARDACSWLANTSLACDRPVAIFDWWHIYLGALIGVIVAGSVALFRAIFLRWRKEPTLRDMTVSGGRNGTEKTLYLHPRSVADFLGKQFDKKLGQRPLAQRVRRNTENRDFFVRIVEVYLTDKGTEKRKLVLNRPLKIVPVAYMLQPDQLELDVKSMNEIRSRNYSLDDDDDQPIDGVIGRYELHIRPTHITDISYWLMHPNNEVRYPIWAAIIATSVEYSSSIVGAARSLWDLFP